MAKVVYCNKVNPSSDCDHVMRGDTVEEVMAQVPDHARQHGMEATPELLNMVRGAIEDE